MRGHLNVSIKGLLREINSKSGSERDKYCQGRGALNYGDMCIQIHNMEKKGREVFTSEECDNILPNGSCGGHED